LPLPTESNIRPPSHDPRSRPSPTPKVTSATP
jgi:hypothetical protein